MSDQTTSIQVADNAQLSTALYSLKETLYRAAEENIRQTLGDDVNNYTALEMRSMVATEALRLTTGMDLSSVLTKGDIIRQIEQEGLTNVHPNGYANLTALASENNVSVSELSDIRSLCDVIFPYFTDTLRLNLVEVWGQLGKSKMREMVPALRSLITGQNASHTSVRNSVTQMLDQAAAELAVANSIDPQDLPDAQVRAHAVQNLLTLGTTRATREVRRAVRPSGVETIEMATVQVDDSEYFAVLHFANEEQKDLVLRILSRHVNNMNLSGRGDSQRQTRRHLSQFFGDRNDQ